MPIYHIPTTIDLKNHTTFDITDDILTSFEIISDYEKQIETKFEFNHYLRKLKISEILNYLDSLTIHWLTNNNNLFLNDFSSIGVSFLINYLKRINLESLLKESVHGNIQFLDDFIINDTINKHIMAHPKGVITHWLAGNVPILGMISMIQGLITKNVNIIKLPRENGLVLPIMAAHIANYDYNYEGKTIRGIDLLKSCMFCYCDRDDRIGHETLSLNSDVRVAWGGREAVETVMSLPRKYGTDDVIFGPRYSFAFVGKNSFEKKQLKNIAYNLAIDVSVFEQQGCNSPHTVFVESGCDISPVEFAKALADGMDEVLKRIPKNAISADQAYTIVNTRTEYSFIGKVFSSKGTEWTVIYSEDKGLAEACYSRTVFVRPVRDIDEVLNHIEHNKHQTLGLCISNASKFEFAKRATSRGIDRITELGKMSVYDYPWDGMFPINQFIRWVSLSN